MKHLILGLTILSAASGMTSTAAAQCATVYLKSGEQVVYSADELDYIEFTEGPVINENENILAPAIIPDETLRSYINTELANGSGVFTIKQANEYNKPLDLSDYTAIASLKGLEYFSSLKSLNVSYLQSLNISTMPTLKSLTTLKCCHLPMNPATFDFATRYPNLTQLSVSYSEVNGPWTIVSDKLTDLICDGCLITSLDVSKCPNLKQLVCSSNSLTSLDISGCSKIEELYVQYNSMLGALGLSGIGSQLTALNVAQTGISDLDISGCINLVDLELQDNYMTGRTLDFSACTKLSHLRCENTGLAGIKVAGLSNLNDLNCYSNRFPELDLTGCSSLTLVNAFDNELTQVKIDGCSSLVQLNLANNKLQTLDISPAIATLSVLGVTNNELAEITGFDQCTGLTDVNLNQNKLTELKVADALSLKDFQCSENQLSRLEIVNCPSVLNLNIFGNQLDRVDLTGMTMDILTTGMFFYESNMENLEIKVWSEFDLDTKPAKWYGNARFVYDFSN